MLTSALPLETEAGLDRLFHALSNQTRRAMLARLTEGPAKVTDLAAPFAMSLPSVSKHLRVLEQAGLVGRLIDGRVHHCTLDVAPLQDLERWLGHYRGFWDDSLRSLADYVEGEADGLDGT